MSVHLQQASKSFGQVNVINKVDLDIRNGEFMIFVGPSGCGKSTLLRMIAGLETVTSGRIFIDDKDVTHLPSSQRGIAMVFQSYALYPHLSVFENMAFALRIAKKPKAEIERRVRSAAEILQLGNLLDRLPKALSGGQRQRVAIGRSIVREPQVFLFDEPLSNLDAALRAEMRVELSELHTKLGATMIYVTHDQIEAMTMADRIVVLNGGHVEQVGSPLELYERPLTQFVAGFIGSPKMNFLTGPIAREAGADTCGIRPEHVRLTQSGGLPGTVRHLEHLGADTFCYVDVDSHGSVLLRTEGIVLLERGSAVQITFDNADRHLFQNGIRLSEPSN